MTSRSQGGVRKIGYLSTVPKRFFEKYGSYYVSLIVRMKLAFQKRGSKSFDEWKDIGEKVCDISLMTCGLLLSDVLSSFVEPGVKLMQDVNALPWRRHAYVEQTVELDMPKARARLQELIRILHVIVVLGPYLAPTDIRRFAWVVVVSCGPYFPLFRRKVMPLLWQGSISDCDLVVANPWSKEQKRYLHPSCQCMSRPQKVPGSSLIARGGGLVTDRASVRIRNRDVIVPHWVKKSQLTVSAAKTTASCHTPLRTEPRFQTGEGKHHFNRTCCLPTRVSRMK